MKVAPRMIATPRSVSEILSLRDLARRSTKILTLRTNAEFFTGLICPLIKGECFEQLAAASLPKTNGIVSCAPPVHPIA